jgi:hypothetical protein
MSSRSPTLFATSFSYVLQDNDGGSWVRGPHEDGHTPELRPERFGGDRNYARTCPDGVDVLFDNAGNDVIDAPLPQLRHGGRIVCSGQTGDYNFAASERSGLKNSRYFITNRLHRRASQGETHSTASELKRRCAPLYNLMMSFPRFSPA